MDSPRQLVMMMMPTSGNFQLRQLTDAFFLFRATLSASCFHLSCFQDALQVNRYRDYSARPFNPPPPLLDDGFTHSARRRDFGGIGRKGRRLHRLCLFLARRGCLCPARIEVLGTQGAAFLRRPRRVVAFGFGVARPPFRRNPSSRKRCTYIGSPRSMAIIRTKSIPRNS